MSCLTVWTLGVQDRRVYARLHVCVFACDGSHGGSGLSRPTAQPLACPRGRPLCSWESHSSISDGIPAVWQSAAVWVTLRTATLDWHGAPLGQTLLGSLPASLGGMLCCCRQLSGTHLDLWCHCQCFKNDHALLTEEIISPLSGFVFK